jgi:hypothetical protein
MGVRLPTSMLPRLARLYRPRRSPRPAHPRKTAASGASTVAFVGGYRPATLALDSLVGSLAARPIASLGPSRSIPLTIPSSRRATSCVTVKNGASWRPISKPHRRKPKMAPLDDAAIPRIEALGRKARSPLLAAVERSRSQPRIHSRSTRPRCLKLHRSARPRPPVAEAERVPLVVLTLGSDQPLLHAALTAAICLRRQEPSIRLAPPVYRAGL